MDLTFKVVIPARMKSTRFPGKPLIDIAGKSMILRTFEQCAKAVPVENICVLTDDTRIIEHCQELDIPVELTSEYCLTGTDRVAEYASKHNFDYYINAQGDEPLMNPKDILKIIKAINENPGKIINGYCPISSKEDFVSTSVPKVVFAPNGRLLYMSRRGIPGNKSGGFNFGYRQVCVYGFPRKDLTRFAGQKNKTPLEQEEDIEILRFLEMGFDVQMIELSSDSIAVDHPEDLDKVLARLC